MANSKQIPYRLSLEEGSKEGEEGGAQDGETKLANCEFLWSWQRGDPKGELMTVVVYGMGAKFP